MTTEFHGNKPSSPPLGLGLREGLGPVAWMGVGCINGEPVFATGDEPRSDACAPWLPLYAMPDAVTLIALAQEIALMATHGATPDGDGVTTSTLLWAEEWHRRLFWA